MKVKEDANISAAKEDKAFNALSGNVPFRSLGENTLNGATEEQACGRLAGVITGGTPR